MAIEIISESNAAHDRTTKRKDYAVAGVVEYWVVDPESRTITRFDLDRAASRYADGVVHGVGEMLASRVVDGLVVNVMAMFEESTPRLPAR